MTTTRTAVAAAEARGETVLRAERGRPTRDMLRSIDVDAMLDTSLRVLVTTANALLDVSRFELRWIYDVARGAASLADDAEIALDSLERSLRRVDVPAEFALVLTAARARLAIDAGRAVTLDGLAALAGCPLSAVQRARLGGELGGRKSGRVVRVSAKAARAWLATRGVT